jgi:hypothetical protein
MTLGASSRKSCGIARSVISNLGTRLPPGGWTHTTLESDHWGSARTIYEARQVVERYVSTATAQPA